MKYLILSNNEQGIIINADSFQDAKNKLKKKLTRESIYEELKIIQLDNNTEKNYIVNITKKN